MMELLAQYETSSVSSSESECTDDHELNVLTPQQIRSVYLLTYSQADLNIFRRQRIVRISSFRSYFKVRRSESEINPVDVQPRESQKAGQALSHGYQAGKD
jgi:hypothetical protein